MLIAVIASVAMMRGGLIHAQMTTVCGNGVREAGEQCDDGNTANLDGCSSQCKFEQVHRLNEMQLQYTTNTRCTTNQLGGAVVHSTVQDEFRTSLSNAVHNGSVSILLVMLGLDDLSGVSDASLEVGIANATPVKPPGITYDATNDLDWWYGVDTADIDSSRVPTGRLAGSIASTALEAGPGSARLILDWGPLRFSSLRLFASNTSNTMPTLAAGANPPGHLTSENLEPALTSYQTSGSGIAGDMCGNIRAASLAAIPIPAALLQYCDNYTVGHTMLDLFVSGCTYLFFQLIRATQPDQDDSDVAPVGGGPPYTLQASATRRVVSCRDKGGVDVDLTLCLDDAAYSSFYKFETRRVIATRSCPEAPSAANSGPVCEGEDIQLTASGPSGTYQWTGPNGFTSTLQNPTIANATTADSGIYSVTVTLGGCTSPAGSTTVTVEAPPAMPDISAPSSATPGAAGLLASVVAHSGATYAWSVTNGTITAGQGTNQITFTAGQSGSVDLAVIETSGDCSSAEATASVPIVAFGPPQNVTANASSTSSVFVTWSASGGTTYEVFRQGPGTTVALAGSTAELSFNDTNLTPGAAYLYTVRAVDAAGTPSAFGPGDATTTTMFTDDPLVSQATPVKAVHVTEIRAAVAAFRTLAGLPAATFEDTSLDSTVSIKAIHLTQLRDALDEARSTLSLLSLSYTDPSITAGATVVKAIHFEQLRAGVK